MTVQASTLSQPASYEFCNSQNMDLFWDKITEEMMPAAAKDSVLPQKEIHGNFILMYHPEARQRYMSEPLYQDNDQSVLFNPLTAYSDLIQLHPDARDYDFVSFFIDPVKLDSNQANYYVPFRNIASGINFPPQMMVSHPNDYPFGDRIAGFQVFGRKTPDTRTLLHEIGHAWCAYTTFKDPATGEHGCTDLLDETLKHWSRHFDCGRSCMEYDRTKWIKQGNKRYKLEGVAQDNFEYGDLDLYLMGLLPKEQVKPVTLIYPENNLVPLEGVTYEVKTKEISIAEIMADQGERQATNGRSEATLKQLWVVVSADHQSAKNRADSLSALQQNFPAQYHKATRNLGSLQLNLRNGG
ncbi:MAG: hypothetical protein V3T17_14525 [Pseudomonadales bacterium]